MDSLQTGEKVEVAISLVVYAVGVVGNLLVIFVILYLNEFKKITHWYVLQLAIADLLFLQVVPFKVSEIINKEWIYPVWVCKLKQTVIYINYYGSIIFLSIMALDRYLAICYGLSVFAEKIRNLTSCYAVTAVAWISAILLCVPVIKFTSLIGDYPHCNCAFDFPKDPAAWCRGLAYDEGNMEECVEQLFPIFHVNTCISGKIEDKESSGSGDASGHNVDYDYGDNGDDEDSSVSCVYDNHYPGWKIFIYVNFVIMFVIPMIIITVCYGLIVSHLCRSNPKARTNADRGASSYSGSETSRRTKAKPSKKKSTSKRHKLRVTLLCAMLVILFAVCWLPFHSVHLAKLVGIANMSKASCDTLEIVAIILVYANSALNPYMYNFLGTFTNKMREIRKHRRTRYILSSLRITNRRRSSSASDNVFTKRTSVNSHQCPSAGYPNEEIPLSDMQDKA